VEHTAGTAPLTERTPPEVTEVFGTFTTMDLSKGDLYLGRYLETNDPVIYPSDSLTTHGVIVGMTGSGKTGLGVVLLEEALLAGIPTLVIDPKGDLGNLLLTFPELRPEDFAPWVEGDDAAAVATTWTEGLAGWGIGPERVAALRDAAEFTIYTPGSTSGVPLNIVGGLARPTGADGAPPDAETLTDEIEGFVSGLLTMVGIEADPLAGREHILLSNLIDHAWASGHDLDLATLVVQVQDPPLRKLGVYELEAFYPAKDRARLAMTLNGLLASRSFAAWAEGPDLDIDRLLRSGDGTRPACAIVSLAHLSDEERQFVVTLLLGRLITWMRRQPGTDSLRLLVYFDEVMGFVPPTAAPPAKKPILTLFKQARAFGVGMVLATQNPVDVDDKGLANAGKQAPSSSRGS
jgi:DNA helicase HerA-like ATPase